MEKIPRSLLGERVIFCDYVLRGLSFRLHAFFRAMLVKPEVRYFNLQLRESVQHWRSKWFYVRDDSVGKANKQLPAFTVKGSVKKIVAWKHESTASEREEVDSLMSRIYALMDQGLTGIHLIALFLKMRIQPLQAHAHPMWSYMGPLDPTRVNAEELTPEEVEERVARLTSSSVSSSVSLDSLVVPYGLARPMEEGLEDPFRQPPLTVQTESSDEVLESPTRVADPEVEEVSTETQRKRN
ncbi:hypothetical protein BRADI_5g06833v3 [Brachypodium distachyon]|uniref:Uncharacterized protein n=1 Tax=Brachypodium distachyon TaxID=15368 RepID=A0A0Q3H247_BRADI|nr:hypothetical protein BRADI_5g06833v3 [Brachypodium distachyon]